MKGKKKNTGFPEIMNFPKLSGNKFLKAGKKNKSLKHFHVHFCGVIFKMLFAFCCLCL